MSRITKSITYNLNDRDRNYSSFLLLFRQSFFMLLEPSINFNYVSCETAFINKSLYGGEYVNNSNFR